MSSFNLLHPLLLRVIRKKGYEKPTLVQELAIPLIIKGYNTLIVAPTGTGKTEAALFPIFSKLIDLKSNYELEKGIYILYITPLRALNRDILRRMSEIAKDVGINSMVRHSDTPPSLRRKMAKEPPELLITTPETLQFILVGKIIRNHLRTVRWVIVDELHEIMDDKRGVQLTLALERLGKISRSFQRIGLSATISEIEVAKKFLGGNRKVYEVVVEMPRDTKILVDSPSPSKTDEELASSLATTPEVIARIRRIIEEIEKHKSALIFTNTRDTSEFLGTRLSILYDKPIGVHHGSLSKDERIKVEELFKNGKIKALVCTSSLELGIDIGHVDIVIQYLSPRQALKLIQRVGRSGHRITRAPKGLIIANGPDDILESLVIARRALANELEDIDINYKALDVLAHQIIGLLIEYKELTISDIYEVVSKAFPYHNITISEINEVVKFLENVGFVSIKENGTLRLRRGTYKYYYEGASTIPDVLHFKVKNIADNQTIGELDENFVVSYCETNSTFILSGRAWKVVGIDYDRRIVNVTPSSDFISAIPAWEGELIPVSYKVAREVGALRRRLKEAITKGENPLLILKQYPGTKQAYDKVIEYIKEQIKSVGVVPDDKTIFIENAGKVIVIHATLGSKINATLSLLLSYLISQMYFMSVNTRSDPYRILLVLPHSLSSDSIIKLLRKLTELTNLEDILVRAIKRSGIYKWRFLQVAKRFGVIERRAFSKITPKIISAYEDTPVDKETIREIMTEKLDLKGLTNILRMIKQEKISIIARNTSLKNLSPMALPIISTYIYYDRTLPPIPVTAILKVIKKRLLEEELKVICLHKLDWIATLKVKDIDDNLKCPKCGSRFIALLKEYDEEEIIKVLKKKLKGARLSRSEEQLLKRVQLSAKLFLSYGKKAAIALAGRGVGPATAVKILARAYNEDELIRLIFEAERNYIRTRQFWE